MSHSPEPWRGASIGCRILDANGKSVALTAGEASSHGSETNIANYARIIASINACRGIPTDELTKLAEWREGLELVVEVDVIEWLRGRGYKVEE